MSANLVNADAARLCGYFSEYFSGLEYDEPPREVLSFIISETRKLEGTFLFSDLLVVVTGLEPLKDRPLSEIIRVTDAVVKLYNMNPKVSMYKHVESWDREAYFELIQDTGYLIKSFMNGCNVYPRWIRKIGRYQGELVWNMIKKDMASITEYPEIEHTIIRSCGIPMFLESTLMETIDVFESTVKKNSFNKGLVFMAFFVKNISFHLYSKSLHFATWLQSQFGNGDYISAGYHFARMLKDVDFAFSVCRLMENPKSVIQFIGRVKQTVDLYNYQNDSKMYRKYSWLFHGYIEYLYVTGEITQKDIGDSITMSFVHRNHPLFKNDPSVSNNI